MFRSEWLSNKFHSLVIGSPLSSQFSCNSQKETTSMMQMLAAFHPFLHYYHSNTMDKKYSVAPWVWYTHVPANKENNNNNKK